VRSNNPSFTGKNATNYIVAKNPEKCPILGCKIMQPDCKTPYEGGEITTDPKNPFGIFVVSDFPKGWIDPICIVCSNKDEDFSSQTAVNQLSCTQSGIKDCEKPNTANVT
jgi:hypothetical protein